MAERYKQYTQQSLGLAISILYDTCIHRKPKKAERADVGRMSEFGKILKEQ